MDSDTKAAVRDYFNRDVSGYRRAYSAPDGARAEIFRERRRLVLELLRRPVGRVLDIGSGPGVFTHALLERGGDCWVADLSFAMVAAAHEESARADVTGVHHLVADVELLPYRARAFDSVLCVGLLQYLVAPDTALRELARIARPGAQVIVTFPNRRSPLNRLHESLVSVLRRGRAALGRLGLDVRPSESRLTFRADVPNASFTLDEIDARSRATGLRLDGIAYHSLHFPFAVPGLGLIVRVWDHLANRVLDPKRLRDWRREIIVRLIREG